MAPCFNPDYTRGRGHPRWSPAQQYAIMSTQPLSQQPVQPITQQPMPPSASPQQQRPTQQLPPPANSVCSISLNMTDRIRLIEVPPTLTDPLRQAIRLGWSLGIQAESVYFGSYEFKLSGNPWRGISEEAVGSRLLIISVLKCMAVNGWHLIQSADIGKKHDDKDSLFFELGQPDPQVQIFAISFNMTDRIRVINNPAMMPTVLLAVQTYWPPGIQNQREYEGSLELKLAGNPWYSPDSFFSGSKEVVMVRILLNHILTDLRALGYKLYGSIDISMGHSHNDSGYGDLESWFFRLVGPCWS